MSYIWHLFFIFHIYIEKGNTMNSEYLALFTEAKYFVICSEKTKKIYIDAKNSAYAFQTKREADQFIKSLKTECYYNGDEAEQLEQNKQIVEYYSLGITNLRVKQYGEGFKDVPITARDVPTNRSYNPSLNRHILLLKETLQKKYLMDFGSDYFYIPISLPKRDEGAYPILFYVNAKIKSGKEYVVLFSTIDEFEKWNEEYKKNCQPLKVRIEKIKKITGSRDIVINPLSDKLFLINKQFKEVKEKDDEE